MTEATTYFKVLGPKGGPHHGGKGQWHLPVGKRPGKWMPKIADPVLCQRGYHVVTADQLVGWLGPFIFEVEIRGAVFPGDNKFVVEQARLLRPLTTWNEPSARLFAADCAEHTLHIFEKACPKDRRPRQAIEATRAYARGEIDDAAWDAARDAAWDAARDAAAAATAAWDAAWDAARAAAGAAAGAAAQYSAQDAALDASQYAAWAAAQYLARATEQYPAWDAERQWQTDRLWQYLNGELP